MKLNRIFASKKLLIFIISFIVLALVLPGCSCSKDSSGNNQTPTAPASPSTLTMLTITGGDVLVLRPGTTDWTKGTEGMVLEVNYKVKTQPDSKAVITFFDGNTIELDGSTAIDLTELGKSGDSTMIKMKQEVGQTLSKVKKLADPASRYEIETTAAVAAVRGTSMYVTVQPDGATFVGTVEGIVGVIAQGQETRIEAGMHTTVIPGQPAAPPQPGAIPPPTFSPYTIPPDTVTNSSSMTSISNEQSVDRTSVFVGDTVTFTYTIKNSGDNPLQDVQVTDDKVGAAQYQSGDTNGDGILDIGETWIFTARYTFKAEETGFPHYISTASGKDKYGNITSAQAVSSIVVQAQQP